MFVGFAPPTRSDDEALEPLDAGDEMTATYALPEELPAGAYVSRGLFFAPWNVPGQTPEGHWAYPFELAIAVE